MAAPLTPKRVSVPGLLSDDGLAQGVSALKGQLQQNATNGASTQGVDISQQILDLDVQMPAPRTPALPVAAPSAINLSGSAAPQQPAAPGFGMLTPEQGAAEQEQRVKDANDFVAAVKSENELGAQLRDMTDEQAEDLGIPRDPFASPEEVEAIKNRLAQQDADYLKQEEERAEYVRNAPDPKMTWWLNSLQTGARAAATTGTSALKYPFSAFEALTYTATGYNVGKTAPREWLDAVDKHIETLLPGDKARAKDFLTELSAGAGSFIPFLLAGYVGSAVGLPAALTAGGLGAAATGNQLYEEAEQFNASMVQKTLALIMGTGLGATEAIPVDRMFMRADVATGGLVRRMLANTTASTLEEFAQEFSQAVGEDMVAKYGAGYDPNRELDAASWLRQGVIGGIVGGGAGAITSLAPAPGPNAAQQVAVVDEVLAAEQKRFDALVNEGEPAAPDAAPAINTNRFVLNDPAVGEFEAGPGDGQTVVKMDDQTGAPDGMVLVELEDGTQRLVGEQLLSPAEPLNITSPVEGAMLPERDELDAPVVPENEPVAVPPLDGVQRIVEAQATAREASVAPAEVVLDPARPDVKVATAPDVTTPEFANWFKNSAVRDESGTPLKVYHGTTGRGFRSFDPEATGINTVLFSEQETHRQGFFFAEKKGFAEGFANQGGRRGGTVMELYLSVQNPLDVTGTDNASVQRLDEVVARAQELDPEITNPDFLRRSGYDNFWELLDTAEGGDILVQAARDLGYDGIKMIEPDLETGDPDYEPDYEGAVTWVAFDPTQIKSATRNTGDFDPTNPDIEAQRASLGLPTRSTIDAVQLSDADTAPLPNIEKGLTGPIPMVVKAARAYASAVGLPHRRQRDYVRVDTARAARIAQAYADMKHEPNDPAVLASYRAMANETIAQYQFVKATGLKIETIMPGQPDPYPNGPRDVLKDIAAGHIWYFPTDQGFGSSDFDAAGNPLLEDTGEVSDNGQPMVVNDLFRVVHDFFGHGLEGSGFGARGEENAWQGHMRLYSQSAIPAMTSETRGQNSWVNYGPYGEQNRADPRNTVYADQKTGTMPSWTWSEGVADSAANAWAAPVELTPQTGGDVRSLLQAAKARLADRSAAVEKILSTGAVAVRLRASGDRTAMAGRDMSRSEGFRLTYFDANGEPVGHSEFDDLRGALDRALTEGFYTPDMAPPQARFRDALLDAKTNSKYGGAVNVYTEAEYAKMRLFLSDDGLSGFALNGEDIVSVFSRGGGRLKSIIDTAIANGGRKLDAFDTGTSDRPGLVQMYASLGFVETERLPFDPKQAPAEWPAELGNPDVVFMALATDEQIESMVAAQTGTPEFQKWFGKSKVVDDAGKPLIVYRGDLPNKKDFTDRSDSRIKGNVFFSSNAKIGRDYARNPNLRQRYMIDPDTLGESDGLYRSYLSLQNPLEIDAGGNAWSEVPAPQEIKDEYGDEEKTIQIDELAQWAREQGYDGLIVRDVLDQHGEGDQYVAFEPTQIKSATGNDGSFSAYDPNIERTVAKQTGSPEFKAWFGDSTVVDENGDPLVVYHGTDAPDFTAFKPGSYFTAEPSEASAYTFVSNATRRERARGRYVKASGVENIGRTVRYSGIVADFEGLEIGEVVASDELGISRYLGKGKWEVFDDVEPDADTFEAADMTIGVKAGSFDVDALIADYEGSVTRSYPGGEGGRVYPAYLSIKNPVKLGALEGNRLGRRLGANDSSIADTIAGFKAQGYDGIETVSDEAALIEGRTVRQFIPFDPEQVKSVTGNNGNFDPNDPNIDRMATGTSSTRMPYSLEPTRPVRGVPEQQGAQPQEGDDVKLTQIGANLRKLLNLTVRHGRLVGGKGVMGEYNRKTGNIRMRTWTDLSTLVHEAGHAINDSMSAALDAFVQRNAAEVMRLGVQLYAGDLSNAPAKTRQREGFAEFFRVYTMTPEYARNKWPSLTADFETTLRNEDPAVLSGLNSIAEQFKAWLQLPSSKLIRNMIVDGRREMGINAAIKELKDLGFKTWFSEYTRRAVENSVNRFAPIYSLVNEMLNVAELSLGAPLDLKRAEDPRTLVRLARNSGSRAMVEVNDGVYAYRGTQPMSRSLRDAIMLSQGVDPDTTPGSLDENRLTDFSAYLVALRGRDEYRRMEEGKIDRPPLAASKGDVLRAIKDYEAQYGQSFTDAAAIAHEYGMALWKKQFDAGLMSKETYEDGLERQFYVPLQRDMSDRKENFGPSALTAGQRSLVRQFKGSDRDIVDPIAILMQKTFALEQLINENEVIRSLALLADRAGRTGALVERIPASQAVGMTMTVEEAARQLSRDDSLSAADAQDLMTILGASIQNGATIQLFRRDQVATKGENILFFWENGKPAAIQLKDGDLGADVVNVLQGVGRENMPLFTELVAATSTAFRTAITSWPDFLIVNYVRDQMSAWILSDVGFTPFVSGIRGMADEIRQKQWAKSYNAAQGIMGGMNVAAMHEAKVEQDITAMRSKGYFAQAFSDKTPFLGAIRGMARVTALSETGTRLGLYRGAYERAKKEGLNDYEASVEAAYLATDYIDFGLNGSRMTLARRTIPFLNAQLQGLYKMMRTLGADELSQRKGLKFALGAYFKSTKNIPMSRVERQSLNTGRKAWVKMASLGLLSAALHFIFRDDPDYEEAGEYLRTTGWVIPMGDGRVFYIPKPFELALIANAVERGIETASGDAQAPGRFLRGVAQSLTPPTAPTSIQLAVELTANKDFFSGRDIVPSHMQALEPQLQYDNRTSSIAKWMGRTFNWSPLVVDHVLSGLGASAYRDISSAVNAADPTRPSLDETDAPLLRRFVRDVRRGSVSAQDFWEQASQTTGRLERTYQTYKRFVEYGNDTGAAGYLATLTADEKAYALLNTHFEAKDKRLNPMYRARQLTTLVSGMRREISSELSLSDTSIKDIEEFIPMTARQKQEVDEILSELARREVRNTLIGTGQKGWADKQPLPIEPTLDLLAETSPVVYEEYMRRYKKAKIYNAETVLEYWPEVRDRLIGDEEFAVLGDVQAMASVVF